MYPELTTGTQRRHLHCFVIQRNTLIVQSGQIHFSIWTNIFCNLDKFIQRVRCWIVSRADDRHSEETFALFCPSTKYILQAGQIYFAIWTNIFYNLDKFIQRVRCWIVSGADDRHSEETFPLFCSLVIKKNTFCKLDKYILQSGQIHFAIWTNTFNG